MRTACTRTARVERAIADLRERGDIYEKDGATWFASTNHGDDKDRVIVKSDGNYAYFAADIAYYRNKRHRESNPADVAIYMLGADHHGYIGRMMAMCAAFGDEPGRNMQILIGQLVNVMKDGKPVRMSKRAGNVVTIDDLVEAVGVDAARYSLARTDYNTPVDIDLDLLASHTNETRCTTCSTRTPAPATWTATRPTPGITHEGADLALLDTEADGEVLAAHRPVAGAALAGGRPARPAPRGPLSGGPGRHVPQVVQRGARGPDGPDRPGGASGRRGPARRCASPRTRSRPAPPRV